MTYTRTGKHWLDEPGALLAVLNLGLGLALLLGDPLRTSSPSFATAKTIMTIDQWGLLFLLGALVCAVAYRCGRWGAVLVGVGGGIHAFWAMGLLQSARWDNRAAIMGIVVYGWIALLHLLTGARLARRVG